MLKNNYQEFAQSIHINFSSRPLTSGLDAVEASTVSGVRLRTSASRQFESRRIVASRRIVNLVHARRVAAIAYWRLSGRRPEKLNFASHCVVVCILIQWPSSSHTNSSIDLQLSYEGIIVLHKSDFKINH
jgi:hypothetical protein